MKTSIRFLAVLFALTVVFASLLCVSAAKYSDVEGNKHFEAIDTLSTLGILSGYSDGTFMPDELVQRDEMAKIIFVTATTLYDAGKGNVDFPDVSDLNWAQGFISWCHTKNIVNGYEDGTFRPENNITYDEALKMTAAMLGYNDFNSDMWPTDVRTVALKQLNLGEKLDGLEGEAQITRAQAAQIVFNSLYQTMNVTKSETVYHDNNYVDIDNNPTTRPMEIQTAMTLAENVWNIEVVNVQVVATENFGVNFRDPKIPSGEDDTIWSASKTGDGELVKVREADNTIKTVKLEDYGLEEYEDNTDVLMFLTISQMFRNGEEFASASIRGTMTEGITFGYHKNPVYDSSITEDLGSSTYALKNKLTVAGVEYVDEQVFNLRAAALQENNGVYEIWDFEPNFSSTENQLNADGTENASATAIADDRHKLIHFTYAAGYKYSAKGWDLDGDGYYDIVSLEFLAPFVVEDVKKVTENGKAVTKVTYKPLYGGMDYGTSGPWTIDEDKIVTPAPLKKGDVFVAAKYSDISLKVDSIVEPVKASITKYISKDKVTATGIGDISAGVLLWNFYKTGHFQTSNPLNYLKPDATGKLPEFNFYIYNGAVLYFEGYEEQAANSSDKALLLYVDKKTDKQLDKTTNKYQSMYPAYLLINGKEEAVNLNPGAAINGRSGDYVSDDESIYRATVRDDGSLAYVYIPVTYTIDSKGYYSLSTVFSDIKKDNDTPDDPMDDYAVEKVIPASENPKLSYHKATGLYTIKTDFDITTYKVVNADESTYLYYTYEKKSTGDYKHIAYYTGATMPDDFTEEVAFASDVFLSYDKLSDMYTITFGVLANEIDAPKSADGYVDYNDDARVIYMAVEDSAFVKFDGDSHYEHTLMNVMTGEVFTVVNEDLSVVDGANKLVAGKFYAWDKTAEDYVRVYGQLPVDSIKSGVVASYDDARNIVYTETGTYFEDGYKIPDDMLVVAFDNELNRYELTFSDLLDIKDKFDEATTDTQIVFMTYLDENDDVQVAYIITDWAEFDELDDGTFVVDLHEDVVNGLY